MKWEKHSPDFKRLWEYSAGFLAVWNAHLGRTLGLFKAISLGQVDRATLSRDLGFNYAAVDSWCDAAIVFGFIAEKNRRLAMSQMMRDLLLDASSAENLGGQFSYLALKSLDYAAMSDLFKLGKTIPIKNTFDAIENATEWDHYVLLRQLQMDVRIHTALKRGCDFLDLGCGTGTLLLKLARSYPKSRFVGIDFSPVAVKRARRNVAGLGIEIICSAAEEMNLVARFDIVHMGEALYASNNKSLVVSKSFKALKPSGAIIIVEGLLPEGEVDVDETAVIRGMQLDFALHGHRFMTLNEVKKLLAAVEFRKTSVKDLGGCLFLIVATR